MNDKAEKFMKAASQIIYTDEKGSNEPALTKLFWDRGQKYNLKSKREILEKIYEEYEVYAQDKKQFNGLSIFLNLEIEKLFNK